MPTTTPFNNLITFSRGSNATVTGSNGLIQWAPNNILTSSQSFAGSGWVVDGAVLTPSTGVAPDGTTTATGIALGTGNTRVYQFDNSGVLGNKVFSLYVKAGVGSTVGIRAVGGLTPGGLATVNAATGAVSGLAGASSASVGSGWYRVSIPVSVNTASGNSTYWTIEGTGGAVFIWGAQLELGSTATTYNPTTVKNLLGFSEAFDNAAWVKSNSSIVTGAQANPVNGLFTAQKLMEDTVAAVPHGFASANVTTIVGTPMTSAFYAKAAGRSWIVANAFNAANKRCWFDLANGTAGTTAAGCTTSITSVGNGWYRCAIIQTAAATTMSLGLYAATADGVLSYTGDGNSGVYIYGAQLSDSASLDPYVPTPGAAPSSTAFYGPRFDFDPVTLQPRGLLVEEQRTNLVTYSDDWSNAIWSKAASNCAITSNATVSPDGTTNADKLIPLAGATDGRTNQAVTGSAGTTYTLSVYGKQAEFTNCRLYADDGGSNLASVSYNLATGAIFTAAVAAGTWTSVSTTITPVGNGWWRMTLTWTATGAAPTRIAYWCRDTGNGTSGIFIWGAQLEAGAFATSYIPTIASTVTRSADVATITGQNFAQWFANNEGSFVFEGSSFGIGSNLPTFLNASDGTTNNYLRMNGASGYTGRSFVQSGGATSANITVGAGLVSGVNAKAAAAYATNSFQLAVNATLGTEDTSGAVPVTPNQIAFGNWFGSAGTILNGHIRNIRFIPARAADFQLQGLST